MIFHPAPGIAIIEEIPIKTGLHTGTKPPSKNLIGRVIAVGTEGITKFGAVVIPPCEVDDVVAFMSYIETGEYDILEIGGKRYYLVEFLDIRAVLEGYSEN